MPRPVKGRGRQTSSKIHGRGGTSAASAPVVTPEARARLPELLVAPPESDVVARFTAIAAETPGGASALIEALGGSRDEAAGQVLSAVAAAAADREQRKAARRALHRLQSTGITVTRPAVVAPGPPAAATAESLEAVQAIATAPDGVGSRLLWLLLERPHGGLTTFNLVINDVVGLKSALIEETTRRRFDRQLDAWNERSEHPAVDLPVEYGLALLSEALTLNVASGFPLPRDFVIRRGLLGELPPPPTDALIHQHVSRGQTFLMPNLLNESERLLDAEPELQAWAFSYDEVKQFARELRQATESVLVLTSEPREARQERILGNALDALFTPALRRAFRRRLEETAYVFWQSGRERSARQAVAAAFAIPDAGSVRSHPLLQALVGRSLEMAIELDRSGRPVPPEANRTAFTPI